MNYLLRKIIIASTLVLVLILVTSCDAPITTKKDSETGRWYSLDQVAQGAMSFQLYCAACHGDQAQGAQEWKQRDADGHLPPPPLNGTAHAWHHPLSLLDQVIAEGGVPYGGTMPGFSEQLNENERVAVVAYFQSFWDDEIYTIWEEINNR